MLRPLRTRSDFDAAVVLQRQVWGDEFEDLVPAATLQVALEIGGIAVGAFDRGELVGLVFGLTGPRGGETVHWSDLLAVRPDHRGRGLAVRLKAFQRERLLQAGIRTMFWTFDPLEAVNARLNLSRLGAIAVEYRRDMYGSGASPLHRGIGTDRLLVTWALDSPRVERRMAGVERGAGAEGTPGAERVAGPDLRADVSVCNPPDRSGAMAVPVEPDLGLAAPRIGIAVPFGIQSLKAREPVLASDWRRTTRAAFEHYFAMGYVAYEAVGEGDFCVYVLGREGRSALMP